MYRYGYILSQQHPQALLPLAALNYGRIPVGVRYPEFFNEVLKLQALWTSCDVSAPSRSHDYRSLFEELYSVPPPVAMTR